MKAVDAARHANAARTRYQRVINEFVDDFRRASAEERMALVRDPVDGPGEIEGLVAAGTPTPEWVDGVGSPRPFFAFPARSFALRLRLMIESPPAFRARNVFVPASYLSRA
jgi:hypothetical protein